MGKNCQPQRLRVKITWGSLCKLLPLGSGSEKMNEILPFVSRSLRPPPVSVTLWEDSQNSRYSHTHQLISVSQLCPTLGDPMDCNTPDFPVHHQLPELAQTHVHWVSDVIQPSHPLSSPSPLSFIHMTRTYSREKIRAKSQREKVPGEKSAKPSIGVLVQWSHEKSIPPTRNCDGTSEILPARKTHDRLVPCVSTGHWSPGILQPGM